MHADHLTPLQYDYEEGVRSLMISRGLDPCDGDLQATPHRAWKAMREMTQGYDADIAGILGTRFAVAHDEMVVVTHIDFVSLCEHHLLPFVGVAHIGYVPDGNVLGLSKLPRLVLAFAQRFQVQERMTSQIADALMLHVAPHGVGVVCSASHQCMSCRGVRQANAVMTTTALRGSMRTLVEQRAEFLAALPRT